MGAPAGGERRIVDRDEPLERSGGMGEIDVRRGRFFRRCTECDSTAEAKRCPKCGSDRASWAFQVDLNPRGEPRRQAKPSGFPTKAAAVAAMGEIQTQAANGR